MLGTVQLDSAGSYAAPVVGSAAWLAAVVATARREATLANLACAIEEEVSEVSHAGSQPLF